MRKIYKALCLFIFFSKMTMLSFAQAPQLESSPKRSLSASDSAALVKYFSKLNEYPLYFEKRGKYIDSILQIMPDNAYMWQQRAMLLFKQRKYEIGMPYLDNAVKYDRSEYLDYRAFMKCIFSKDYSGSIADFNEVKKIKGNQSIMDHSYDFYIGLCYLQLNNFDSAEYFFTKTIDDEKEKFGVHALHWFYLGIVKYEKEDYPNAIACFDSSLSIYHNFSDAKYYKALCLESLKKYSEASKVMNEAALDFKYGTTINEDNVIYEKYPYQISKGALDYYTEKLQVESEKYKE